MQETLTSRHRPLGVSIIAFIETLYALFEILIGIIAIVGIFTLGHVISAHGHVTTSRIVDTIGGILGGISLAIGILTLIFAVGLWLLKRWAFWLTIIIQIISLVRHALEFTRPHPDTLSIVLGMLIPVVILLYFLLDPNVRRAFRI